ncbi:borealin [Ascaphus truei]|uniref:borealin n=1 Tax=Ascaphus truei TaxID=8439 RepID=UPI003F5A19B7
MPPAKKRNNRGRKNPSGKNEKMISFLKDFDSQVKTTIEQLRTNALNSAKEVASLYNIEIIKRPVALREMCWIDFFAKGGSQRVLEAAESVNQDIEEINRLTASVSQTPFKSFKKAKKTNQVGSIEEDEENIPEMSVLRTKTKAKFSTKKVPTTTRKARASATSTGTTSKRISKRNLITPTTGRTTNISTLGPTPMITPRFDPRIFKTPALRTPGMRERVYTFSANGSPLADVNDLFISVPVQGGENIRVTANELDDMDLTRLDRRAFDNIQLLSNRLTKICNKLKSK